MTSHAVLLSLALALLATMTSGQQVVPSASHNDLSGGRHNTDLAARVSFGTAISLILPVALGVALVALLMPLFTAPFGAPYLGATNFGYARKGKSFFGGISQEQVMNVLDSVTKAVEAFSGSEDKPKPK